MTLEELLDLNSKGLQNAAMVHLVLGLSCDISHYLNYT